MQGTSLYLIFPQLPSLMIHHQIMEFISTQHQFPLKLISKAASVYIKNNLVMTRALTNYEEVQINDLLARILANSKELENEKILKKCDSLLSRFKQFKVFHLRSLQFMKIELVIGFLLRNPHLELKISSFIEKQSIKMITKLLPNTYKCLEHSNYFPKIKYFGDFEEIRLKKNDINIEFTRKARERLEIDLNLLKTYTNLRCLNIENLDYSTEELTLATAELIKASNNLEEIWLDLALLSNRKDAELLKEAFIINTTITHIIIANVPAEECFFLICDGISTLPKLKSLEIKNFKFPPMGAYFDSQLTLQNFWNIPLNNRGLEFLGIVNFCGSLFYPNVILKNLTGLKTLRIGDSDKTLLKQLTKIINTGHCSLNKLEISTSVSTVSYLTDESFSLLKTASKYIPEICIFKKTSPLYEAHGALDGFFNSNCRVKKLYLRNLHFRSISGFCSFIKKNLTLVYLDLSFNLLGFSYTNDLFKSLAKNKVLRTLKLANNLISGRKRKYSNSMKGLIQMLTTNSTLQEVDLAHNLFVERDLIDIIISTITKSSLRFLNLGYCNKGKLLAEEMDEPLLYKALNTGGNWKLEMIDLTAVEVYEKIFCTRFGGVLRIPLEYPKD